MSQPKTGKSWEMRVRKTSMSSRSASGSFAPLVWSFSSSKRPIFAASAMSRPSKYRYMRLRQILVLADKHNGLHPEFFFALLLQTFADIFGFADVGFRLI